MINRKKTGIFIVVMTLLMVANCTFVERLVDATVNRQMVLKAEPDANADASRIVRSAFVVDLHADTLLFSRGLEGADSVFGNRIGIVDAERLVNGDVALQVLSTVSEYSLPVKATLRNRYGEVVETRCHVAVSKNGKAVFSLSPIDGVSALYRVRYPLNTRFTDLQARILEQADRFDRYVQNPQPKDAPNVIRPVRTARDLSDFLDYWEQDGRARAAILAIEGLHFYRQDTLNLLWQRGFRMASLTHHFDNVLAASSNGCHDADSSQDGLKARGESAVEEMRQMGWVLDMAHASDLTIRQTSEQWPTSRPPVVSHTGIEGLCDGIQFPSETKKRDCGIADARNIARQDIVRIARMGGIIGVMYWPKAVEPLESKKGEEVITGIVNSMVRMHDALAPFLKQGGVCPSTTERGCIELAASEYIALGSDWDGAIKAPIDTGNLAVLVSRLLDVPCGTLPGTCDPTRGKRFSEADIRAILGWNACRVLMQSLPGGLDAAQARIRCYGSKRQIN